MSFFEESSERTLGVEGAYVNRADDPGGETNWGITWPVLTEAIQCGIVPAGTTIKTMTRERAKAIYFAFFWQRGSMDRFSNAVAFECYDAAVNHGISASFKMLQRAVGVKDDGQIGPVTLAKINTMSQTDVLFRYLAERADFFTYCAGWPANGRGWIRRLATVMRYAAIDT